MNDGKISSLIADPVENVIRKKDNFYFYIKDDKLGTLNYAIEIKKFKESNSILIEYFLVDKDFTFINKVTGTGHAKKVYSTVLNTMIKYVNENNPDEFCFSSEEDHKRFYRFYAYAIRQFFPNYDLKDYDELSLYLYKNKNIQEGSIENHLNKFGTFTKDFFRELKNGC